VAGIAAAMAAFAGVNELLLLLIAGLVLATPALGKTGKKAPGLPGFFLMPIFAASTSAVAGGKVAFSVGALFLFFLKIGSVLYGSGYVLLAFLRNGLVGKYGWLTEAQLLDAVAVGQITPGPVFTTATFIGYILGGTPAALAATLGIFLPAFFFVAVSGPLIPRIRKSPVAGAFLDGVNVASLALMAVVTVQLGRAAVIDWLSLLLAVAAAVLLFRYRVNSAWLVLGGAALGTVKVLLG
jgi:chromate transporter